MVRGIRLNYSGHDSEDGSVVNGFTIIKNMGADYRYAYLCIAPECGHECIKDKHSMRISSTGMCRECSWKLPNTMKHNNAKRSGFSPTYSSWIGMVERCSYPKHINFENYGGRGIKVCGRWLGDDGFTNFLNDMGERPDKHSLDRVDVDGNYTPENCRWADRYAQAMNKRSSKKGRRGVRRHQDGCGWIATFGYRGENMYLGYYKDYDKALAAREEAELKYLGYILE